MFNVINKPAVTLTDAAVSKVKEILDAQGQEGAGLRVYIAGGGCSGFKYGMALDNEPGPDDEVFEFEGLKVFIDSMSLPYLRGASVDYVDDALLGQGFKVDNPNAVSTCGCGSSFRAADSAAPAGGGCGSGGCGTH
jgi:iron-sulfur cluster assembly accessory protein